MLNAIQNFATSLSPLNLEYYHMLGLGALGALIFPTYGIMSAMMTACFMSLKLATEYNTSTESDKNGLSLWGFMFELTYRNKQWPEIIAITGLLCILSTVAPLTIMFAYSMLKSLEGPSIDLFYLTSVSYLTYIVCRFLVTRVAAKIWSQNFGARQGARIVKLFGLKQLQAISQGATRTSVDDHKNIQEASRMTSDFWYFLQTVVSACIAMASSFSAVLRFSMPIAYQATKTLILIRTASISVLVTCISIWKNSDTSKADKAFNEAKQNVPDDLSFKDIEETHVDDARKEWDKNDNFLKAAQNRNIAMTIQDAIYDFMKNLCSDNALILLVVINLLNPSFPLGGAITITQVTALSGVLGRMVIDFLSIARNMSSLSSASGKYAKFKNPGNDEDEKDPLLSRTELIEHSKKLEVNQISSTLQSRLFNVLDSLILISALTSMTGLFAPTLIALPFSPYMLQCTITLSIFYFAMNAVHTSKPDNGQKEEDTWLRWHVLGSNTVASLLFVRMVGMFAPTTVVSAMTLGLITGGFYPQLMAVGIFFNLALTTFVTPYVVERANQQTQASSASSNVSILAKLFDFCNELLGTLANTCKKALLITFKSPLEQFGGIKRPPAFLNTPIPAAKFASVAPQNDKGSSNVLLNALGAFRTTLSSIAQAASSLSGIHPWTN